MVIYYSQKFAWGWIVKKERKLGDRALFQIFGLQLLLLKEGKIKLLNRPYERDTTVLHTDLW